MRRDLLQVRRGLRDDSDEGEPAPFGETAIIRPRPSSWPPSRGRREDTDRRKEPGSERFVLIRRQQAEEQLRLSHQALERGDHRAALEAAERAVAIDPDYRYAFVLMDRFKSALEGMAIRQSI